MIKKIITVFIFLLSVGLTYGQSISGIVNSYTAVTNLPVCNPCGGNCNTVTVASTTAFAIGDKVLIIQMKGASTDLTNTAAFGQVSNYAEAGNYEFKIIQSIAGSDITFTTGLSNTYNAAGFVQLVRVPIYANPTVTAPLTAQAWNGTTGGIIAIEVTGTLTLSANIDVRGLGFRGGISVTDGSAYPCGLLNYYYSGVNYDNAAPKGEGISEIITGYDLGKGAYANAGGGGNSHNGGGGGGSNGGSGGVGGNDYCSGTVLSGGIGGYALNTNSGAKAFLGGGGGAGHQNNDVGTSGGNGGGLIFIKANQIIGNGFTINASGMAALNTTGSGNDGAGGGGAGGTIKIETSSITTALSIFANGGKGGDMTNPSGGHAPGGGAGGGVICTSLAAIPALVTTQINGGARGIITADASSFGTSPGTNGVLSTSCLAIPPTGPKTITANLGSDVVLCNPISTNLSAGLSAPWYTYKWYLDDVLLSTQTASTLTAAAPGEYKVIVSSAGCLDGADSVNITTKAAIPNNVQFCAPPAQTVSLSVTGAGKYKWWNAATGGLDLAKGLAYAPTLSATQTFYVEDTATFSYGNFTPKTMLTSFNNRGWASNTYMAFNALTTFTIDSVTLNIRTYNTNTDNMVINLRQKGNPSILATKSLLVTGPCNCTQDYAVQFYLGFTVPPGNDYYLEYASGSVNVHWDQTGAAYPYSVTDIITITGPVDGSGNILSWAPTSYGFFYNWKISAGILCSRVPVTGTLFCPPPTCTTPTITSAATGTICSGVAQNYAITSSAPSSYAWTRAVVAGISNAVGSGSATPITETLTNTTAAAVVVRYIIIATTTTGACVGNPFNYDVTVNPTPTITSAATGTICSGIAQNYTITSVVPSSYAWTRAVVAGISNAIGSGAASPITETLTNTTLLPVVVRYIITPTSTMGSCPGTPFNYDVTVNPKPAITSAATGTICSGVAQNYAITSNVPSSYAWTRAVVAGISNAIGSGSATPITETLTNTTTAAVVVRYIITPTATTGGCVATAFNYDVTVNPKPAITSAATGNVCSGIAQNYAITSNVPSSYAWTRAVVAGISNAIGSGSATPITETLTNTTTAPVVVRYIITPTATTGGCIGTAFNYDVTVNPTPTITSAATGTICSGVAQNYAITSNIPSSYAWTRAVVAGISNAIGSGSATPITETLTNTTAAAVVVRYIITPTSTTGSCLGTPFNYDVTVNPAPVPSVTIATPSTTICAGTSITFTATPTNGGAAPTYVWKKNTVVIAGATGATYTTTTAVNGDSYTAVMTSNAVCPSGNPATSNAVVITVTSTVTAAVSITAAPAGAICAGTSVTFTASPGNGGAAPTYEWFINGATQGAPSTAAITFTRTTLVNGDAITVRMVSNSGCVVAPGTATSTAITMVVNPLVTPAVTIAVNPTGAICAGTSITFTATPTNGGAAPTYQWKKGGVDIAGATGVTYTTTTAANGDSYTVTMTSNANCASPLTATSTAIVTTVNPILVPGVTVSASPTTICTNGSTTFTAVPTNPGTTPVYQWLINTVVQAGQTTAIFTTTALTASADVVKVILTSNAVCATPLTATASMSVTVNTGIGAGVIGIDQTICYNTAPLTITQTGAPTSIVGVPTYTWESSLNGSTGLATIAGATGSTYTPPALTEIYMLDVLSQTQVHQHHVIQQRAMRFTLQ